MTRAWLGDFGWALPGVGVIGIWVVLGFCTVLLLTGITKVDPGLYESARIDGAGWFTEFVRITVPLLRQEIGVCLTVTVIAALAAFDIVYVTTAGGPGNATARPRAGRWDWPGRSANPSGPGPRSLRCGSSSRWS